MPNSIFFLTRNLPEQCSRFETLKLQIKPGYISKEFDECIRRLPHLKRLNIQAWEMPKIANHLALLPASPTHPMIATLGDGTSEETCGTFPWARIRKVDTKRDVLHRSLPTSWGFSPEGHPALPS